MPLLTIGGTAMPEPIEYAVTLQDLDSENTNRSETGMLHRDRIRAGVYKIEVTWQVRKSELKRITDAITGARFSVSFFDPTKSSNTSGSFYAGDKSSSMVANAKNGNESLWTLSVSLTEY